MHQVHQVSSACPSLSMVLLHGHTHTHTQMKAPTLTHRQLATLGLQLEACRGLQRLNYFIGANGSSFRLARACTPQYPTNTGVGQIQGVCNNGALFRLASAWKSELCKIPRTHARPR